MLTIHVFGSLPPHAVGLSRDLRALWAAEECGLPYKVHIIDAMQGGLSAADHLARHPFGQLPVIEDDGLTLFESGAIVHYLAEKSGKLLPADTKGRALALQWTLAALNTLEPQTQMLAIIDLGFADAAWAKERRPAVDAMARKRLAVFDSQLADRPYLMGDELQAPDILLGHVLRQVRHTDMLNDFPNLAAYKARCEARPAWQKIFADYESRLAA